MKKLYFTSWLVLLVSLTAVFMILQPMSGNFARYLAWRYTTDSAVQTGVIERHGARIKYVSYGIGKPVLLLHGGLSNKLSWYSQLPWLVEKGRQVILIDTRGHGESTQGDAELNYQTFADDTLQVLDELKIARTDIIGWSDGGIIALLLGLEAPQRVDKIVAISANFHPSGLIADNSPASRPARNVRLLSWLRGLWSYLTERNGNLEARLKQLWHVEPQLSQTDLQAITAPTLVITGENDIIDLPHSSQMAQMLGNAKIDILLDAGHAAPVTHAKQVNRLLASFLDIEQ
ncbi:alpha/beta fold hydrolase [Methylomonas methanica]|uniref:Alpha/beta hydrolase fold protein n=1 Tax=Methylomonas methanica (strain DSM 25384 / MC09) TaxID=857087 RepID=G0A1M3_METMM|nr:alpha/beta hydrolase [Methylomonas methanica]AEG00084.1 alpha/beta hydrolase fold protein [Methylomonas methanica MC09]